MKRQVLLAAILLAVTCAVSPAQVTSSVVQIQVGDSVGSGAYLGDRLVLSCAHLFAGENSTQAVVTFPSGERHTGRAVSVDDHWDQSLIELQSTPHARGVRVASVNPQPGQRVAALGYAFGGELKKTIGNVVHYVAPSGADPTDWFAFTGAAAQGCSGGPIFNERGELIGNLWGARSTNATTVGVLCGRTQRFLLPWRARLEAARLAPCVDGQCPPAPTPAVPVMPTPLTPTPRPPTDPLPPASPPSDPVPTIPPPDVDVEIDYAKIADLVIERMKADPEPFRGPAGLTGAAGSPGPPGAPGKDGANSAPLSVVLEDKSGQAASILSVDADGVLRLPPVVLEIETPDGKVQQQAKPLGHPIRIKLVPVTNKT